MWGERDSIEEKEKWEGGRKNRKKTKEEMEKKVGEFKNGIDKAKKRRGLKE